MNSKIYQQNLRKAMNILAKEGYIFIGQTIVYGGSPMYKSLEEVNEKQKIEFPVCEDTQLGVSLGMSLEGIKVCSIFPRIDFLICATNQLVNHAINALKEMGCIKVNLQVRATNREVISFYESLGFNIEERVSMGKLLE